MGTASDSPQKDCAGTDLHAHPEHEGAVREQAERWETDAEADPTQCSFRDVHAPRGSSGLWRSCFKEDREHL